MGRAGVEAGSQEGMAAETDARTKCLPVVPAACTFAGSGLGSEARGLPWLIVIINKHSSSASEFTK